MNMIEPQAAWVAPRFQPDLGADALQAWTDTARRVSEAAQRYGWSKSEVSRRSGVPMGTFSQWYDGNYAGKVGNVSDRLAKWLDSVEELSVAAARIPVAPGYVPTPTAIELTDTLLFAQMMPEMVVVTLGAGMGKTMTANAYRDLRPHAYLVTMRPTTATVHGMLLEFAQALDVTERNAAKLDRALGERLRRNGRNTLLIVDEAQHLNDQAVNQLRYFLDIYGVGIALLGNEELYGRFGGAKVTPAYAQIHRRIGKRMRRLQPLAADVEALLSAWDVKDPEVRKLARVIGRKPGALSQITKTLQLAGMYAAGEGREVTAQDVSQAWTNRSGEDS